MQGDEVPFHPAIFTTVVMSNDAPGESVMGVWRSASSECDFAATVLRAEHPLHGYLAALLYGDTNAPNIYQAACMFRA